MARAIDANAVLDRYYAEFEKQDICDGSQDRDWLMRCIEEAPTITPPNEPNEPLTLEQLREMDGEPVWIVDIGGRNWYGPGWAIVDRDNCLVRTVKNWNPVFFERYGELWIAYRRPKEEQ